MSKTALAGEAGYEQPNPHPLMKRAAKIVKGNASFEERFVPDHDDLKALLETLRQMGCGIAFTMGVWDLFHIGHAKYIERGREEAAKLLPGTDIVVMVVGVDSDELTRSRKGPTRPIVPEDERWQVLSYLRAVDIITPQYVADTLHQLVRPDVRVISMSTKDLPELEEMRRHCGHLVNLPPQAETSTTARVRKLSIDGAGELAKHVEKTVQDFLKGNLK